MNEKKIELIQQDIEQINVLLKLPDKNKQFDLINRVVETWKGIGFNPSKGLVNWNAFYNDRMLEVMVFKFLIYMIMIGKKICDN